MVVALLRSLLVACGKGSVCEQKNMRMQVLLRGAKAGAVGAGGGRRAVLLGQRGVV